MLHKEQEILDWARERQILDATDPAKQIIYSVCEFLEALINWENKAELEDAIGDTFVTLVAVANIGTDKSLAECKQISRTVKSLSRDAWRYLDDYLKGRDTFPESLGTLVTHLDLIARQHSTTLERCIDIAYGNISGRSGSTVDGVFRKNEE